MTSTTCTLHASHDTSVRFSYNVTKVSESTDFTGVVKIDHFLDQTFQVSSEDIDRKGKNLPCTEVDVNSKLDMRLLIGTLKYFDNEKKINEFCLLDDFASQWRDIGLAIGLSDQKLDSIRQSDPVGGDQSWLREVFILWMQGSLPNKYYQKFPSTWKTLIKILEGINLNDNAEK